MLTFITYTMMVLYPFVGLILIAIILLQRGRGGGLAGAFGGMGGQSAFGTKAGDVFTKITIVLATIWIVMGGACVLLTSHSRTMANQFKGATAIKAAPDADGESEDGDKTPEGDDVVPGPAPATTPDAKPGTDPVPPKADPEKAAAEKPEAEKVDPEKNDPEKPEAEKPDPEKTPPAKSDDAANEAAKSDSKEAPADKPAEPAKGLDDSVSPPKGTDATKPE